MEARSEPINSQVAVAAVTMNRVMDKDKKSTICRVVYQPGSFSWTNKRVKVKEPLAFNRAKEVAMLYLSGKLNNPIGSRKYFNHISLGKRFSTPHRPIRISKLVYY